MACLVMYKMLAMLGENGFQTQAKTPSSQEKGARIHHQILYFQETL